MQAIYYNVTILITFKTPNNGAMPGSMPGYVAMFLALETFTFVVHHHVDCRWWSDSSSLLLYNIKFFNYRYGIIEHLWSLLVYVGG